MLNNIQIDEDEREIGSKNKGINILTILTLIGCGVALISVIFTEFTIDSTYQNLVTLQEGGTTGTEMGDKMLLENMDYLMTYHEYRYPMLAIMIVFTALCLIGALMMRKGKQAGLWIWLVGEWVPMFLSLAIFGMLAIEGSKMIGLIVPITFTVLYFAHKKYLVKT